MTLPSRESTNTADLSQWFANEVQPHEPVLRAWLRARFPNLNDVDDLVQEAYVRLFRARAAGRVGNAKNYLFATARNAVVDLFRHDSALRIDSIEEIAPSSVLHEEATAADRIDREQELQILREAMYALPERCRQVFTLRKLYGLSHQQIATRLSISEKTVEAQIDKAMRRCAAFLRSRGLP